MSRQNLFSSFADTRTARANRVMRAYRVPVQLQGTTLGSGCTVKCNLLHAFNRSRRDACKSACAASDAQAQAAQAASDAAAQAALAQAAQAAANALIPSQGSGNVYTPTQSTPGKYDLMGELINGVPNYITYPVAGFGLFKLFGKKKKGKK